MSNNAGATAGTDTNFMRFVGTLAYTIFKVEAWIVGFGAIGFAIVFYMIDAMEPFAGAIGIAVGTGVVYLIVTKVVRRICNNAPAAVEEESSATEKA